MKKDKCRFIAETSEIMDLEKLYQLKRCKRFGYCDGGRLGGCRGCNVWNSLYDIDALKDWCEKHDEDFTLMTMRMQKQLIN
jgi:hypothetical protein